MGGGSKAAGAAGGGVQLAHLAPGGLDDGSDDQLGDPVAPADHEILLAQVDQKHLQLAAIVRIDGAGGVGDGHAGLQRQA